MLGNLLGTVFFSTDHFSEIFVVVSSVFSIVSYVRLNAAQTVSSVLLPTFSWFLLTVFLILTDFVFSAQL